MRRAFMRPMLGVSPLEQLRTTMRNEDAAQRSALARLTRRPSRLVLWGGRRGDRQFGSSDDLLVGQVSDPAAVLLGMLPPPQLHPRERDTTDALLVGQRALDRAVGDLRSASLAFRRAGRPGLAASCSGAGRALEHTLYLTDRLVEILARGRAA